MKTEKELRETLVLLQKEKAKLLSYITDDFTISPGAETMTSPRILTVNTHIGILRWVLND